jgi:hypothetical protein
MQAIAEGMRILNLRIGGGKLFEQASGAADELKHAALQMGNDLSRCALDKHAAVLKKADVVAARGFIHVWGADEHGHALAQ